MNFGNVKGITIPEGKVSEIVDSAGKSLWKAGPGYIYLKMIDRSISGTYTNETVESIGNYAFGNCSKLTTVVFPVVTSIGGSAFAECYSLTTVNFPAATSIGSYAFNICYKLTTINFPIATSIGEAAFQNCTSLTTTNFPAVTSIGENAFIGCASLITLILRSETMATLGSDTAFNKTPIASGTGYIYVPATLVNTYKAATNWTTYANQIRAIEDYPEITGGEMA